MPLPSQRQPRTRRRGGRLTSMHQVAQRVGDLAQVVAPLRRVLGHQAQIRGDKDPFVVTDIGWIWLGRRSSTAIPQAYQVHNSL